MAYLRFKDIEFNKVFNVYTQISSKRYEERRAILVPDNNHYCWAVLYILDRRIKMEKLRKGNYGNNRVGVPTFAKHYTDFWGYSLNKPENCTIIRKVTITITTVIQ